MRQNNNIQNTHTQHTYSLYKAHCKSHKIRKISQPNECTCTQYDYSVMLTSAADVERYYATVNARWARCVCGMLDLAMKVVFLCSASPGRSGGMRKTRSATGTSLPRIRSLQKSFSGVTCTLKIC